jgi:hypothetical protein
MPPNLGESTDGGDPATFLKSTYRATGRVFDVLSLGGRADHGAGSFVLGVTVTG